MDDISDIDLKSYSPSQNIKNFLREMPIILLVGPTGAGKDTLVRELLKTGDYYEVITNTTRPPRKNHGVDEVNGVEYYFIDTDRAREMLKNEEYIEAELIHGNIYGTNISEFEKAKKLNKLAVTDLGYQGARNYRKLSNKTMAVFLLPPSFDILLERLAKRYGHAAHDQDIINRIKTALNELKELIKQDFYYALINDDLALTTNAVHKYVQTGFVDHEQDKQARKLAREMIVKINSYLENYG